MDPLKIIHYLPVPAFPVNFLSSISAWPPTDVIFMMNELHIPFQNMRDNLHQKEDALELYFTFILC